MSTNKLIYGLFGLAYGLFGWCAFVFMAVSGCRKNTFDTKDLLVYAPPGTSAYNVIAGGNIALIRSTILAGTGTAFPVLLTRPFNQDVEVTAKIDTGLVRVYDSLYNVTSPSLPAGAFQLANNGRATVKAGQSQSGDSLRVQLTDASNIMTGTNIYIIPVVLASASNGVPVSGTRQVMYVKVNIASIATGLVSLDGTGSVSILLNNVGGVNTGTDMIYLRTVLNQSITKAVTANAAVNTALVDTYNSKNGTHYQAFPDGSYQLVKAGATIPANAVVSADSIQIQLPDLSKFITGTDYLLPVTLKDGGSPDSPPVDGSKNVVYVVLSIFVNNVDPANPVASGTVISRTAWSVAASSDDNGAAGQALDGDNSTSWFSGFGLPQWLRLDMGASYTVKGFSIVPNYMYGSNYCGILNMDVLSSNDGTVWKLEGKYVGTATAGSSSAGNPDIKHVKFVTPVTARYFKFNVTQSTDGWYAGMAELNGIE
ncbi:MAG: DUF1735 domain-containing protein [Chitinophagaceae bacterium]|nr:DUF1735 domain-containing protein [Chitinophagaceae bacterium]